MDKVEKVFALAAIIVAISILSISFAGVYSEVTKAQYRAELIQQMKRERTHD